MLIEVELFQVVILEKSLTQVIVLREREGERRFPIYIGLNEAMAIDRKLNNRKVPRPLTHDLLQDIVEKLGARIERIVINDLRDQTFYAQLDLAKGDETIEIDSRPSDAIALAVRCGAPIFVADHVLEETSQAAIGEEELSLDDEIDELEEPPRDGLREDPPDFDIDDDDE